MICKMRICIGLVLFVLLCKGVYPTNDFNLPSSGYNNDLQLEADLNTEMEQSLIKLSLGNKELTSTFDNAPDTVPIINESQVKNYDEIDEDSEEEIPVDYINNGNTKSTKKNTPNSVDCNAPPIAEIENFVGSNLFDRNRKKCFSVEDVALIAARRDFEYLIPKDLPQCLLDDEMIGVIMHYFHGANQIIHRLPEDISKQMTEKAFYDMLGGYLKYYIVPLTKYSFYAGKVCVQTVEKVLALYRECKRFLNTNGNGWKGPIKTISDLKNIQIDPLKIDSNDNDDQPSSCINLDLSSVSSDGEDEHMIVALPKLEPEDSDGYLGNIWLPFKRKRTFNLRSAKSASIVVKFYEIVTKCYKFESICQDVFNHKFRAWIMENIQVHLSDEQFYPGLGSILQIYENLQRGKKAVVFNEMSEVIDDELNEEEDEAEDEHVDEEPSIVESVKEKRQKTDEFMDLENKSKQLQEGEVKWLEKLSDDGMKSRKECIKKPKPKCKPTTAPPQGQKCVVPPVSATPQKAPSAEQKGKPKSKSKSKSKSKTKSKNKKHKDKKQKGKKVKGKEKPKPGDKSKFSEMFSSIFQKKFLKYAAYLIATLISLFLFVLLFFFLCKKINFKTIFKKKCDDDKAKKKRRCATLCGRLCRKKKKQDEEVLIKADSTSVIPSTATMLLKKLSCEGTKSGMPTTSSSSVTCKPKTKWLPYAKREKVKTQKSSKSPKKRCSKDSNKSDKSSGRSSTSRGSSSEPEKKRRSSICKSSAPCPCGGVHSPRKKCPWIKTKLPSLSPSKSSLKKSTSGDSTSRRSSSPKPKKKVAIQKGSKSDAKKR